MTTHEKETLALEKSFESKPNLKHPTSTKRKNSIVRIALKLFLEQGYNETSLRQIAAAADVSPSLIVHYFGTKQALVHVLLDSKLLEVKKTIMRYVDIRENPELFCCTTIRLFQTIMSSGSLGQFYHALIEEGLFREFLFYSEGNINSTTLILRKRQVDLSPDMFEFYCHYLIPSVEMAIWLSSEDIIPSDEKLDIPFRTLMKVIDTPTADVDEYCHQGKILVNKILDENPELFRNLE